MLTLNNTYLEIELANGESALFHYVWLRDNCQCLECLHPDTGERILVTANIAEDIAPVNAQLNDANDALIVEWNQSSHQSAYSLNWLAKHDYSHQAFNNDPAYGEAVLWGKELEGDIPTFDYQSLHDDAQVFLAWCCAVRDYGLTIIRNAPLVEGEIERFADYVAVVRETIYDRLHNVRATPGEYNAYNVASTTLELKPHTDMPNYNNPPGVQMFHFLINESEGGESTAVDGFKVAAQLQQEDPQAYQLLATTPMTFRMHSARGDIIGSNPLLTLDTQGALKVFRFSNQLAQPANMPVDKVDAFYAAYRKLGKLLEAPENKIQFKLGTGDIMVTNNLRVLHGRNSYNPTSGGRHLQLSYMDMDDVMSRIRMLLKQQQAA